MLTSSLSCPLELSRSASTKISEVTHKSPFPGASNFVRRPFITKVEICPNYLNRAGWQENPVAPAFGQGRKSRPISCEQGVGLLNMGTAPPLTWLNSLRELTLKSRAGLSEAHKFIRETLTCSNQRGAQSYARSRGLQVENVSRGPAHPRADPGHFPGVTCVDSGCPRVPIVGSGYSKVPCIASRYDTEITEWSVCG